MTGPRSRAEVLGQTLLRGGIGGFSVKIGGAAAGFVTQVILARLLGVKQYGVYVYVLAWFGVFLLSAKLGWEMALVRFVASYSATGARRELHGLLRRAAQLVAAMGVALGALAGLVIWVLSGGAPWDLVRTAWLACLLLPVNALFDLARGALQGLKRVVLAYAPSLILRPLLLGGGVALLYFLGGRQEVTAPTAMAVNLVVVAACLLLMVWFLWRSFGEVVESSVPEYRTREWMGVALSLLLVTGMTLLLSQTDTIMVGMLRGSESAGIYATAARVATLIAYGLSAANTIVAPMIAQLYSTHEHAELERVIELAMRAIVAFTVPVALVLCLAGRWILAWFGPAFPAGYGPLLTLIVGQCINALLGPVGLLMLMTELERKAAWILVGSAILNLVLNAALIPRFGIEGAAAATAFTTALWNVVMYLYVRSGLGIRVSVFHRGA